MGDPLLGFAFGVAGEARFTGDPLLGPAFGVEGGVAFCRRDEDDRVSRRDAGLVAGLRLFPPLFLLFKDPRLLRLSRDGSAFVESVSNESLKELMISCAPTNRCVC